MKDGMRQFPGQGQKVDKRDTIRQDEKEKLTRPIPDPKRGEGRPEKKDLK